MLMRLTPQFAALFTAGIVAAGILVASERRRGLPWHWLALGAALPVVAIIAARGPVWTVGNFVWVDLALGPATALLLAGVAVGRPRTLATLLETAPLQRLGACSYSLYLTHSPIVVMVSHAVRSLDVEPGMPTFLLMLAVAVPIAVVFAMVVCVDLRDPVPAAPELGRVAGRGFGQVDRKGVGAVGPRRC